MKLKIALCYYSVSEEKHLAFERLKELNSMMREKISPLIKEKEKEKQKREKQDSQL